MREYLLSIIGAVLITVFADVILPEKWNKYVKIITGLIIISTIISPLEKFSFPDMSQYFREANELTFNGEQYQKKLICEELERKISEDIKIRIKEEFNKETDIKVTISFNNENQITGIRKIEIIGEDIDEKIKSRLKEIYAPGEVSVNE